MPETDSIELERRICQLEGEIVRLQKPSSAWREVWQATIPSLISGLAVVIVGYFLTGAITNALQEKQYRLSNVTEMRDLILKLWDPKASLDDSKATARTLSAFGQASITPLINLLESGGDTKILAAQEGLRAVALSEREAVCSHLAAVINNRTRLFTWETHRWAIHLAGELDCQDVLGSLKAYAALLEQSSGNERLVPYASIVKMVPAPTLHSLERLRAEVNQSQELLRIGEELSTP